MNPSSVINFDRYDALLERSHVRHLGKVTKVVGLTIESIGPEAKLNDLCIIKSNSSAGAVKAEVVGFRDDRVLLMPYDNVEGVGLGSWVENTGAPLQVSVSDELLGKTLDGVGEPMNAPQLSEWSGKEYADGHVREKYEGGRECDRSHRRARQGSPRIYREGSRGRGHAPFGRRCGDVR